MKQFRKKLKIFIIGHPVKDPFYIKNQLYAFDICNKINIILKNKKITSIDEMLKELNIPPIKSKQDYYEKVIQFLPNIKIN